MCLFVILCGVLTRSCSCNIWKLHQAHVAEHIFPEKGRGGGQERWERRGGKREGGERGALNDRGSREGCGECVEECEPVGGAQVLDVTGFLKFAVQMAAMFESRFNSVERLLTYHGLPQEAAPQIPDKKPPPEWPQEGRLAYRDVWLRYRPELDPVLKVNPRPTGFSLQWA